MKRNPFYRIFRIMNAVSVALLFVVVLLWIFGRWDTLLTKILFSAFSLFILLYVFHSMESFRRYFRGEVMFRGHEELFRGDEEVGVDHLKSLYHELYVLLLSLERKPEFAKLIPEELYRGLVRKAKTAEDLAGKLQSMNEYLNSDLDLAKRVQENVLPSDRNFAERNEFHVGALYCAMDKLGGDFYDVIRIGRNGYGFLIADVSGHGTAAALITMMVKLAFNAHSGWNVPPEDVMNAVNRELCELIGDIDHFVTAAYGALNLEDGMLSYSTAAHVPMLLYRAKGGHVETLTSNGSILGKFENYHYKSGTVELFPGDKLLMVTDGIVEAQNARGKLYGMKRLSDFLKSHASLSPSEFVEALEQSVVEYDNQDIHNDDRSILFVEFIDNVTISEHLNH